MSLLQDSDIVTIELTEEQVELVHEMSSQCWFGTHSAVRTKEYAQSDGGYEDQVTGQKGELALHIFLFGEEDGVLKYIAKREEQNADPFEGDGGFDIDYPAILPFQLDVKTSQMRSSSNRLRYNLVIRDGAEYEDSIYILALIDQHDDKLVHLVGWVDHGGLPEQRVTRGTFRGAKLVVGWRLNKMADFD